MQTIEVDESLYSRQLYVVGKEAMRKMAESSVLISGMSGLGVEIAKCVILSGVKSVLLHDNSVVKTKDLSSNYYINYNDIGKKRVDVVKEKLSNLNPYVNVDTLSTDLDNDILKKYQTVVICEQLPSRQIKNNNFCRENNIKFIIANIVGVVGSIFCDFGDNFIINDNDGEEIKSGVIIESNGNEFKTFEHHQLYIDDVILLDLNGKKMKERIISTKDSNTFEVANELSIQYDTGIMINSTFTQIKQEKNMKFDSLEKSVLNPKFSDIISDDFDKQNVLHNFMMSFDKFINKYHVFPEYDNNNHIEEITSNMKVDKKYNDFIRKITNVCSGKLCPIESIIASITAQEVMKSISGKFTPINQWIYFDFASIIPEKINLGNLDKKSRYFGQNIILGVDNLEKLKQQHLFIVGAGAIGCELLKNLAMIGVGNITITDMDTIEKSNLNRQFLFGNKDIGKFKSECAASAINIMNNEVNIMAHKLKVAPETNHIYNREFFKNISCVLTALDNVQARMFVDSLCVENCIPMIDSGTLGTKGNVQVVIPHITEQYSASVDPPEKSIPLCTLKNFPYLIDHTIQWGRNLFEGWFVKAPSNFMRYKKDPSIKDNLYPSELAEIAKDVNFVFENDVCDTIECVLFGYRMWHEQFRDQIYHLIQKFPENFITNEKVPFWSGTKKFPSILKFDINNEIHINFIESIANLWADVFGLQHCDKKMIKKILKNMKEPQIKELVDDIKIDDKKDDSEDKKNILEMDNIKLPELSEINYDVYPLSFEKDDDKNFHIDFITSASNLRAINYKIEPVDKLKTKGIAGKIIPAIATTTSLVSGLVTIEFIKIIQGKNKIGDYSNTFANLALPFFAFSEPMPVAKSKIGELEFSIWDTFVFDDQPLNNIIDQIKEKIGDRDLEIFTVSVGNLSIIGATMNEQKKNERLNRKVGDLYKSISKNDFDVKSVVLSISFDTEEDSDPISCVVYF
jgi:ubiquitin-activating enzyme E1